MEILIINYNIAAIMLILSLCGTRIICCIFALQVNMLLPIVFLIVTIFLVVFPIFTSPIDTGIGLGILASGIPVYIIGVYWKNKPKGFTDMMGKSRGTVTSWWRQRDIRGRFFFFSFFLSILYSVQIIGLHRTGFHCLTDIVKVFTFCIHQVKERYVNGIVT